MTDIVELSLVNSVSTGKTTFAPAFRMALVEAMPYELLFRRHFEVLRLLQAKPELGYLVALVNPLGELEVSTVVPPTTEGGKAPAFFGVGRHPGTHFASGTDASLALRHLAVRVMEVEGRPRVRLFDLNTQTGTRVEGIGTCPGVESDGPVFARCGLSSVMFFPVLPGQGWPTDVDEAWAALPKPSIVDKRVDLSLSPLARRVGDALGFVRGLGDALCVTQVHDSVQPPRRVTANSPEPADTFLRLTIDGPNERTTYFVNRAEAERGVLLGRYDRCEVSLDGFPHANAASRVHGLIALDRDGRLVYADVGSTGGSWLDEGECQAAFLPDRGVLALGDPQNRIAFERVLGD